MSKTAIAFVFFNPRSLRSLAQAVARAAHTVRKALGAFSGLACFCLRAARRVGKLGNSAGKPAERLPGLRELCAGLRKASAGLRAGKQALSMGCAGLRSARAGNPLR